MRKVDRTSVPEPAFLNNLSAEVLAHLLDYKKISGAVYAHDDVKRSLKLLYFDKCYICENDVSAQFDVEHFYPKKYFQALGYNWSNLHKSCTGCNLAKERKEFLIRDKNQNVVDINLLDPSHASYNVEDYIEFNLDSVAQARTIGQDPILIGKAQNTILYLNGSLPSDYGKELKFLRASAVNRFLRFCVDSDIKNLRNRIQEINNVVANYSPPADPRERGIDQRLCELLINADDFYLNPSVPFSSNTKNHLFPILKINYGDLVFMKNKLRAEYGM